MRILVGMSVVALAVSTVAVPSLNGQSKSNAGELIALLSGTWKEDQSKRQLGAGTSLRFRTTASGQLEELRGPVSRPMVQPVRLDGKTYDMESGNTITWKQIGANEYERRTALNGKLLSVRRIRISGDGKTLTEESQRNSLEGKTNTRMAEYGRASGEAKGLAGTWDIRSANDSQPAEMTYQRAGENALKVNAALGQTYTLTFDGKPATVTGASVIPNMMISGKYIDSHTLETTSTREGVAAGKSDITLSRDGKTMTVTTTAAGPESSRRPSVTVFYKQ
ncbi:MAG: hypothetical protein ABJF23_25285 [Bryobacteraceae bacterium]